MQSPMFRQMLFVFSLCFRFSFTLDLPPHPFTLFYRTNPDMMRQMMQMQQSEWLRAPFDGYTRAYNIV